ncbi:hypothetical protein DYB32_009114 [Aphanomyces invadans]|uniref:Uncharacterized protein n=1 Tax=Aphanomyces invadans TaxID=157072 RepID=A0A3R7A3E4_9STRA|nr:hypothetical protein DYB32_009114 [Aphanomyces invadans]
MASRKHKWTLIILVVALLAPLFADGAAMTAKSIRKALAKVGKKALKAVKSSGSKSSAEFCWKNSYGRGVGKIPESCKPGQENQAGLCYKTCTGGFKGVGPVCWGQPPSGWVNCGMGAAVDSFTCAEILADQILSVGQLALNVVSGGASSGLKSGWKSIKSKGLIKKLRKKVDGKLGFDFLDKLEASKDPADMVRLAASITAMLDPTGASDVVQAYAYSTCDKVTQ